MRQHEDLRKQQFVILVDIWSSPFTSLGIQKTMMAISHMLFLSIRFGEGMHRLSVWKLDVSRSIGDVYLKKPEFNRDPIFQRFGNAVHLQRAVLSAEPSIISRKLEARDLFLIFASDGLWEHLSDNEAVEIVYKNPRAGIAKRLVAAAIQEVAKKRELGYKDIEEIEKGTRRHFHDDITAVVVYLDRQNGLISHKFKHGTSVTAPVDIFSHRTGNVVDGLIF